MFCYVIKRKWVNSDEPDQVDNIKLNGNVFLHVVNEMLHISNYPSIYLYLYPFFKYNTKTM